MKILLIHAGDPQSLDEVRRWRKKKAGLGEIYELSLIENIDSMRNVPEARAYLERQIAKAKTLYGIEEIVWL